MASSYVSIQSDPASEWEKRPDVRGTPRPDNGQLLGRRRAGLFGLGPEVLREVRTPTRVSRAIGQRAEVMHFVGLAIRITDDFQSPEGEDFRRLATTGVMLARLATAQSTTGIGRLEKAEAHELTTINRNCCIDF